MVGAYRRSFEPAFKYVGPISAFLLRWTKAQVPSKVTTWHWNVKRCLGPGTVAFPTSDRPFYRNARSASRPWNLWWRFTRHSSSRHALLKAKYLVAVLKTVVILDFGLHLLNEGWIYSVKSLWSLAIDAGALSGIAQVELTREAGPFSSKALFSAVSYSLWNEFAHPCLTAWSL